MNGSKERRRRHASRTCKRRYVRRPQRPKLGRCCVILWPEADSTGAFAAPLLCRRRWPIATPVEPPRAAQVRAISRRALISLVERQTRGRCDAMPRDCCLRQSSCGTHAHTIGVPGPVCIVLLQICKQTNGLADGRTIT